MLCPNCGNPTSRKHTCEHCGYVFARKNSNHSFRNTLLLVLLMLFIAVFLWAASLNYLNFHGYSTEKISSNGYPSPASLLNDYMKYAKEGKPRFVLSTFHPEIIRYYSDYYSKNEDILWASDAAYRNDVYMRFSFFFIDKEITWSSKFYQGELENHNINCSEGKDFRLIFQIESSDGSHQNEQYYYEMVEDNGRWYMLSVYE